MKVHAIVHKAEEGGYWAEVPSIPGCATQGETLDELRFNLREAIEGCLSVPVETPSVHTDDQVIELALQRRYPARNSPACWNRTDGLGNASAAATIFAKAGSTVRISVPIHGNATLKAGFSATS